MMTNDKVMYTPIPDHPVPPEQEQNKCNNSARRVLWLGFLGVCGAACVLFGTYMACFYLRSIVQNKLDAWDLANPGMFHKDRWDSNLGFALHLVGGAYLMLFGPLQFVPSIRRNWIGFHRWNGRLSVMGCILASLGAMYYILAVGVTSVTYTGQQANWSSFAFGLSLLLCAVQTVRHAAFTKRIDQHKLWAYRVAGICLGNIFARIYLLVTFIVLGEDPNPVALKGAIIFIQYTFFLPFIFLASEVWKREQKEESVLPAIAIVATSVLLMLLVVGVVLVALFTWVPFMNVSLNHDEDGNYEWPQ